METVSLEDHGGIAEAQWHYKIFTVVVPSVESGCPFVSLFDLDEILSPTKSGEITSSVIQSDSSEISGKGYLFFTGILFSPK